MFTGVSFARFNQYSQIRTRRQLSEQVPPRFGQSTEGYCPPSSGLSWEKQLGHFLEIHRNRLIRRFYKHRQFISEDEAKSLAQEVIVRAFGAINYNRHHGSEGKATISFLNRTADNLAIDRFRLYKKRGNTSLQDNLSSAEIGARLQDIVLDTESDRYSIQASSSADHGTLWCLEHITPTLRMAFFLNAEYGFTPQELSIIMGLTPENLKLRTFQARKFIQKALTTNPNVFKSLQDMDRGALQIYGTSTPSFYSKYGDKIYTLQDIRSLLDPLKNFDLLRRYQENKPLSNAMQNRIVKADEILRAMDCVRSLNKA